MQFTRKQYLNDECTHEQYFAQFITEWLIRIVESSIWLDRILQWNDQAIWGNIELKRWGANCFPQSVINDIWVKMRALWDYPTEAWLVCISKACARIIKSKNTIS